MGDSKKWWSDKIQDAKDSGTCAVHPNYAAKRPPTSTDPDCNCKAVYKKKHGLD